MQKRLILALLACAFLGTGTLLSSLTPTPEPLGLEALDGMVGTWVVADEEGKPTDEVISVVRSTAAGSVLMETLFPGQDHEMITMYYTSGDDLMLTHYCGCTNHPIMKASRDAEGVIHFDCIGRGENFASCANTTHMHDAILRFEGKRLHSTWTMLEDGKPGHVADFKLVRLSDEEWKAQKAKAGKYKVGPAKGAR